MRVLLTTLAATSHLNNLVPLAWALRSAGHEVCVAAQPNLTEAITRAGLTAVAVGEELATSDGERMGDGTSPYGLGFDIAETRPEILTPEYVRGALEAYTSVVCEYLTGESMTDDLVEFARAWRPDLVVWDSLTYAGPVAALASGAAHARVLVVQDHWVRMRELLRAAEGTGDDPLTGYLTRKLARYGAAFDETAVTGQVTVDPLPSWTRFPLAAPRIPMRYVPYNGTAVIPGWLLREPRRPRVCLTLGVTGGAFGVHEGGGVTASELLDALAALDVEVIATIGADRLAPGAAVPDNVRLFDFVPLNALAPTCAAIIHHGGAGTLGTALVHGVPQLIVPSNIWGEPAYAAALASTGAGIVIDPASLSADLLKGELHRLLEEPSFRENAARVRQEMLATPSPRDVVGRLEDTVQKRGNDD
jgi:glycosyltransferase (activator-dependent family)